MAMLQYQTMPRMPRERYVQPPLPPLESNADQGLVLALLQMMMRRDEESGRNKNDAARVEIERKLADAQTADAADTRKRVAMMEAGQRSENYINREHERVVNSFRAKAKDLDEGIDAGVRTGAQKADRHLSELKRAARKSDATVLQSSLTPDLADNLAKGFNTLTNEDERIGYAYDVRQALSMAAATEVPGVAQKVNAIQQMIPHFWETYGIEPGDWKSRSRAQQNQELELRLAPKRAAAQDLASRLYNEGVDPAVIPQRVQREAGELFRVPDFDVSSVRARIDRPILPTEANPTPTVPATHRLEDLNKYLGGTAREGIEAVIGSPQRSQFDTTPPRLTDMIGPVAPLGIVSGLLQRMFSGPQPTPIQVALPKPEPVLLEAVPEAAPAMIPPRKEEEWSYWDDLFGSGR